MENNVRNSVKVLLFNHNKELLMISSEDPNLTNKDNVYHGKFWTPLGGKIEEDETLHEAALREVYEESMIEPENIKLGPIVWYGEFDLNYRDKPVHIVQKFIVAHTNKEEVGLQYLTEEEKKVIDNIGWFSLNKIKSFNGIIYPVLLRDNIENIINKEYPSNPIKLDLSIQPE